MEYRGWAPGFDQVVFRGDTGGKREFVAFWMRDGKVAAAMNANIWDQGEQIEALLRSGLTIDPARLADEAVDLAQLTPTA
jgi:3-phenylpropionate/trans-cinnamate dioxygenase ferredoxin reductase subunit